MGNVSFPTAKTTRHSPRFIAWGYTKLKNYRDCPRRHLQVDIEKKWSGDGDNEHLDFGNAVHKAIEDRLVKGKVIDPHLQVTLKGNMEGWCKKLLQGYNHAADWENARGGVFRGEQQLAMDQNFQPCGWFDKTVDVWLRVKIDVCKVQGPVALLIDWKTGKVSDREQDQLIISAAMIFSHYPQVQRIRTQYVWLKENAETTLDVDRSQMPEFWAKILPEVKQYQNAVTTLNMPPRPSGLCGWCPVKTCEHHPRD